MRSKEVSNCKREGMNKHDKGGNKEAEEILSARIEGSPDETKVREIEKNLRDQN